MAASMSRALSLRTRVLSIGSPAARVLPARRSRDSHTSRTASPCGDACTCRGRTRRLPDRTTCRNPCTGWAAAGRPAHPLHAPKRILLALDGDDLVERLDLVVTQVRAHAQRPRVRLREVNIQDVPPVDLAADRDPVHGDRDLLSRPRAVEALLPASNRLDPAERAAVLPHERLARPDACREDSHAEDRRLGRSEDMLTEEQELRGVRHRLAARRLEGALPLVPPRAVVLDEPIDDVALQEREVRMLEARGLRVRKYLQVERQDRTEERVLRRRGVGDVAPRDRPDPRVLDRDRGLLAPVGQAFERADRVGLDEDAFVLRLDVDL